MSNFDRNRSFGYGARVTRAGTAEVDQGLRAYMLGVYNYMTARPGPYRPRRARHPYARRRRTIGRQGSALAAWTGALREPAALGGDSRAARLSCFFISARANNISAATARNLFLAFSAVMGLSMSSLLIVFTGASVARVFFITAAAFGGLSIYGYMTKRDLSPFGSFLIMGVWGLVIAGLVNLFLQSSGLQFTLSILSVLIFSGLTAWDTQSIKDMYYEGDGYEVAQKKSVFGALSLYLDFINMFQSLLFLFGQRND